jgi:hypothetical protein
MMLLGNLGLALLRLSRASSRYEVSIGVDPLNLQS